MMRMVMKVVMVTITICLTPMFTEHFRVFPYPQPEDDQGLALIHPLSIRVHSFCSVDCVWYGKLDRPRHAGRLNRAVCTASKLRGP